VDIEPEPRKIGADALDILLFRPLAVGIVDPQHEAPARPARPQPVVERGADVADMQRAGGRGGEAGGDGHDGAYSPFRARRESGGTSAPPKPVRDRVTTIAPEIARRQLDPR